MGLLGSRDQTVATGATLGPQPGTPANLTRFLIILTSPNLFLNSTPLNELAESPHGLLDRFAIPKRQFDHVSSFKKTKTNTNHLASRVQQTDRTSAPPTPRLAYPDSQPSIVYRGEASHVHPGG